MEIIDFPECTLSSAEMAKAKENARRYFLPKATQSEPPNNKQKDSSASIDKQSEE